MSNPKPHRVAGTVLSQHRTSMGLVRYRWWDGSITVELVLDEPAATLAVVPGSDGPKLGRSPHER